MDREAAKKVDSPESLRQFLINHRRMANMGFANEIDYVGVDKDFHITIVHFKGSHPLSDAEIQAVARRVVGCELHHLQVEWVRAMLNGQLIGAVRRAGYTAAYRVAAAILKERENVKA